MFIENGLIDNKMVAIKKLGTGVVDLGDKEVLAELKAMKDIKHDNVNTFIGICLEQPNSCVLMTYASRGSLADVLQNGDVKLTWDFKLSIITDIAQGMKYLHASAIGNNCNAIPRCIYSKQTLLYSVVRCTM